MRAPVPAALPAEVTRARSQSGIMPRIMAWRGEMWAPKAPASTMRWTVSVLELVHEQAGAGVEGGLGELDGAHVALGDEDVVVQAVGVGAALRDHAVGAGLLGGADEAGGVDEAGGAHLGDRLDDAGAADAGDAGVRREAGVVGPGVDADDAVAGLLRHRVDLDALDGAGGGALAGGDLRALEGGAGGGGAGEDAGPVAEQDLGVGADVDDEHEVVGAVGGLGEGDRGGVGADVAGDAGQDVDAGVLVQASSISSAQRLRASAVASAKGACRARSGRCRGRGGA